MYTSWFQKTTRFQKIFDQLAHNITITGFKALMKPQNIRICCSIYNKIETG